MGFLTEFDHCSWEIYVYGGGGGGGGEEVKDGEKGCG